MMHESFGAFGALGGRPVDSLLAKAVILAGLLPREFAAQFDGGKIPGTEWAAQFAHLADNAPVDPYSQAITLWPDLAEAQQVLRSVGDTAADKARFSSTVKSLWKEAFGSRFPLLRLAVTRSPEELSPHELANLLTKSGSGVCSVLFAVRVEKELQWNWPLQIGVPQTPAGQRLRKILDQGRYRDLYQTRAITGDPEEFDLLLLPEQLAPDSPFLRNPDAVRASAMLVLEEKVPTHADALRLFASFALHRAGLGLTGICWVAKAERLAWINTLIRELSHNATLDQALFQARLGEQRRWEGSTMPERNFAPPFLAADPWFLEQSRIAQTALRIADSMKAGPQGGIANADVREMGTRLANDAGRRQWISERGDARELVQTRLKAEAAIGLLRLAPIRTSDSTPGFARQYVSLLARAVPRMRGSEKPPAAAGDKPPKKLVTKPSEARCVQCKILKGRLGSKSVKRLEFSQPYRAHIHIGADITEDALRADVPLDESQLPPSRDGHDLQIAFCPLDTRAAKDGIVSVMVRTIHLPKEGKSGVAKFSFVTGEDAQAFRARILVLHRNRILQTLMLATPAPDADVVLRQESLVSPVFSSSESEKPADLALVVNDNPAGLAGITAITEGSATFSEPAGLNVLVETIESLLSKANISTAGEDLKLDHPKLVALMIQLATQGVALTRELKRQISLPDFQQASRVQLVEARSKAYLPVEFVYTGKPPNIDARLCPNAKKALAAADGDVHAACEHANDPAYVCPAAFWGFSKCIERQPFGLSEQHLFSIPQPGADTLAPFKAAVLAASEKVTAADLTGANGVEAAIATVTKTVRLARSWKGWQKDILAKPTATLLVLLPHSDNSPDFVNIPALEIQKNWLTSVQLDSDYVLPPNEVGPGPVVLLIGCSTALADIPFLNFVREFKAAGASIVLGTLATVHGTHASRFVRALLGKINVRGSGRPFDEILLEVKREMLAEGEPFVLSLAAYGHSSWRIQT